MEDDEEENPIGTLYAKFPHARTFIKDRLHAGTMPYREMYAYYKCAMMIIENKFKVLSEELSLEYDHNPIDNVYDEGISGVFSINRIAAHYKELKPMAKDDLYRTVDNLMRFFEYTCQMIV